MMDREEEYLSNFFSHVSQLSFDKAKELVEREKEVSHLQSTPWNMLIVALSQFAASERSYVELGFFANRQKSFLRKDNSLRSCYEQLRSDMHRIEDISKHNRTVNTVATQLGHFMTARVELIEFYEKMQACGATKPVRFSELQGSLEELVDRHALACPHLSLTWLKAALSLECEVLVHLVRAGAELADWRFLPSLMLLHGAHTRLQAWEHSLGSRESWRLGSFLATPRQPLLHQWLSRLRAGLCAKFALLFYGTLAKQTTQADIRALCSKLAPATDFHHKLQSFQHKASAQAVFLVFDLQGMTDHEGPGYRLPLSTILPCPPIATVTPATPTNTPPTTPTVPTEIPTSDPRFAQVLCVPQGAGMHLAEVARVLTEKAIELSSLDKVIYNFNPMDQRSVFLIGVDPRLSLATVYAGKRPEKDSLSLTFLSEMAQQLRGNRILAALKPGSK